MIKPWSENFPVLKKTVCLMSVATVAFVSSGGVAFAEDEADFEGVLEEVIVTASRRDESLQDTALSVAVVTPSDFDVGGLVTLRDILEYTPGVTYAGGSAPVDNKVSMRGVSSYTSSPTVGIYIDDVPIGSASSFAAGATQALDAMQNDIQRVEVIKGPQGTLYGASAMGGVIRYITRDPSMGEFGGSAKVDLSSTKEGGFNQIYSARLSGPLVSERLGASISAFYEDNSGFIDRIEGSPTGAAKDVNGFESHGITAKFDANITDNFTGSLLYMGVHSEFSGRNEVPLDGPPWAPVYGPYLTDTGESTAIGDFALTALTLNYEFKNASLISTTSYEKRDFSDEADLVAGFGPLLDLFSGSPPGTVTSAPFTGSTETNRFYQEVRLMSIEGGKFDWTIGGMYSDEESGNGQKLEGQPIDFLLLDVDFPSELTEYAGFGSFTYYFNDKFDIEPGIRIAHVKSSVQITDGPEILVQSTPLLTDSATHDTYSLSARYRPNENLSYYGRIASGYRPATANLPVAGAQPIIASDSLWSYEVGAKGTARDSNISYDFALWYINWDDLQANVYFEGVSAAGNIDSGVTAYGLEGTVNFNPIDRLDILTNFAYTKSTLDDDETKAFNAKAGSDMPGIPKWTASIRANYEYPLSDQFDGFVGAGLRYVGSRTTGFEPYIDDDGNQVDPRIANIDLDDYVMADIRAGFIRDNITLSLYVTNLFDEYTYVSGVARPGVGDSFRATVVVAQPRTIGAMVRFEF